MGEPRRIQPILQAAALGLGAAAFAAFATASIFEQRAVIVTALMALIAVPFFTLLSGNARLLCLWALMLTLPIDFSKFFGTLPHMGGEYAFRIDVFTDTFLALLTLAWIVDATRGQGPRFQFPGPLWPLAGLAALAVIDTITGPWHRLAAMEVIRMMKVGFLFLFTANQVFRPGHFHHVLLALTAGCLLQSVYGLLQYFFDLNLGLARLGETSLWAEEIAGRSASRVSALMGHPNLLSGYLCLVMPVPLALLFAPVGIPSKAFALATLMASQATLILTLSRNGWVSFFLAACIVVGATLLHPAIRFRTALLRGAMIGATLVVLVATSRVLLDRLFKSNPEAIDVRFEMNRNALRLVSEKPILGYGKNSYAYLMVSEPPLRPGKASLYRETVYDNPSTVPPIHNIYLQQWVEQGTIGLLLFFAMLLMILIQGVRNFRVTDQFLYMVNAGALGGIVAILVHGLADWVFWWSGVMRIFFVLAGLVFAVRFAASRGFQPAAAGETRP